MNSRGDGSEDQRDAEREIERSTPQNGQVRTEGEVLAVREVEQFQDAVDERQPGRSQREVRTGDQAVDGRLRECRWARAYE
jgi:hypothetical protein